MHLLLCTECRDILKLIWRARCCACGLSSGLIVERGERQVGHFTGPALPLEAADLSVKAVLHNPHHPNGSPVRLVLRVVDPEAVDEDVPASMRGGKRYRPRKKKRRLPKHAKPFAQKRRSFGLLPTA